jgi:site-specific recombinase XerD
LPRVYVRDRPVCSGNWSTRQIGIVIRGIARSGGFKMKRFKSFTTAKADDVLKKCEYILSELENRRLKKREEAISRLTNRKFFKWSRENAEEEVDSIRTIDSPYKGLEWGLELDSKDLIALCKQSSDGTIFLDKEDAFMLQKYYEEDK